MFGRIVLDSTDELSETASMPKQLTPAERPHWSRVQAAVLNRFNWPAKRKASVRFAVELASEIADMAAEQYRKRIERNGK
jgi:hypothetical protein